MERTIAANGNEQHTATGNACAPCYKAWEGAFRAEYKDFTSLAKAFESGTDELRERISTALRVHSGVAQPSFPRAEVSDMQGATIKIQRHMVILGEAELRSALRANRLLKCMMRDLRSLRIPAERALHQTETVFCFSHPDRPFRTAIIETSAGVSSQSIRMPTASALCEAQASHFMQQSWETCDATSPLAAIAGAKLPCVDTFLASQGVAVSAKRHGRGAPGLASFGDEAEDEDDLGADCDEEENSGASEQPALVGVAAACSSFVSPSGKQRPQVPSQRTPTKPLQVRTTSTVAKFSARSSAPSASAKSRPSDMVSDDCVDDGDDDPSGILTATTSQTHPMTKAGTQSLIRDSISPTMLAWLRSGWARFLGGARGPSWVQEWAWGSAQKASPNGPRPCEHR